MRITNKIIQNNQLSNINTNKTLQDTLSTQIASGKTIARPSDDPIVALRSLRLRTSVNQTEQYLKKNVEDAESWLTVTEDSITTLSDIITDIRQQYTKGTSDTLAASDRQIIIENLQSLAAEVYNTGNADFAGRSVFTGYRTSSNLTFQKDEAITYSITQEKDDLTIDTVKHVSYTTATADETAVNVEEVRRIRLAYNDLDGAGNITISYKDATGTKQTITCSPVSDSADPYGEITADPAKAVYIPETGEIIFGKDALAGADISSLDNLTVEYSKTKWSKGDLRPEHYFNCKDNTNNIEYKNDSVQEIEYNIGVNQSLRINTTADECFSHDIARDIDDVIKALNELTDVESQVASLKIELSAATDDATKTTVQNKLDAANKALTYIKENVHTLFSSCITKADGYLDANNLALTNCGTRSKRLELIQNRLDTQLNSLNELKSENEDADTAETAIKLASAQYAYDAALMSASKILKENLLNYI